MDDGDPKRVARRLLDEQGLPEAWQHSTREAIDVHLRHDAEAAGRWAAVQQALTEMARRPGAGDLKIYRSAQGIIGERGPQEAWRHAMQQGVEAGDDLLEQAYWLRIAEAVIALAKGHGTKGSLEDGAPDPKL